ncbi:MAG: hypothetical protein AB7N76_08005 [Planctomycetota bacterium]
MKKHLITMVCASALLAGLTGCVDLRVGRPIPAEEVKRIREGASTSTEVKELFGAPHRRTKTQSGEIWVYRYVSPDESKCQELVVSFGEDDTVCVFTADGL